MDITCYLGLGSNLGSRGRNLGTAIEKLGADHRVHVENVSSVIESSPMGGPADQPNYYNAVAQIRTSLSAGALLELCRQIEDDMGRVRKEHWGPRVIDLDILLYGDEVITSDALQTPHPLMHERLFVMQPLVEIAPGVLHPLLGMSAQTIYESLTEQ